MRRSVSLALALAIILVSVQAHGRARGGHGIARVAIHNGFFAFRGPIGTPFRFRSNFPNNNIVPPLVTIPGPVTGPFGTPFAFEGTIGGDFGGTFGGPFVSGFPNSNMVAPLVFMPAASAPARPFVTRIIVNNGHGVFANQVIEQGGHGVFRFDGHETVRVEKGDGAKIIEVSSAQGG